MATQKVLTVNGSGKTAEVTPNITSAGSADSGKLIALNVSGQVDSTMLPTNESYTMTANESVAAGAIINVMSSGNIRNADNTVAGKEAHGFAPSAITGSATGTIILGPAVITGLSSLTPGSAYYLGTTGGITLTAPSTSGNILQPVGIAKSATELAFQAGMPITRG